MQQPSVLKILRDILILPFTVTIIVPFLIYEPDNAMLPTGMTFPITGTVLFLCGLALLSYTIFQFTTIGKGTLAPWAPTQKLVIEGPYAYCRNPMITGVLFMLIGEALFFNSINMIIWSGVFFIINSVYFVFIEEPDLLQRFGDDYKRYKERVPRWIPGTRPYTDERL